jgi:signal transduction histidine kinase
VTAANTVPAEPAVILTQDLVPLLLRFRKAVAPLVAGLDRRFARLLSVRGFGPKQRRAILAITPGAFVRLQAGGVSADAFFEQVSYNGRRLAKLDGSPERIRQCLGDYARLIQNASLSWNENFEELLRVLDRLELSTVLALNEAFYQVRQDEAQSFYELFQAELECRSTEELTRTCAEILARYCRAEAGHVVLSSTLPVALSRPHYFEAGSRGERFLAEPGWKGAYQSYWSVPILAAGRAAGVMQFAFNRPYRWLPSELRLLSVAAQHCLRASEKSRLIEDLRAREQQVRELAQRILETEEAERRRIGRELHDESGQLLMCLRLQLELLEQSANQDGCSLAPGLRDARELVERTILEIRRLLSGLSPAILEQLGLGAALRQLAKGLGDYRDIRVGLRLSGLEDLPPNLQTAVYRLVQESCNNIARHSSAHNVNISAAASEVDVLVEIEDDGVGFQAAETATVRATNGLAGMRERVALLGGSLFLDSDPGRGAKIRIRLPAGRAGEPGRGWTCTAG